MKLVKHMDRAVRLSDRRWKQYLRAVVRGDDPDIAEYGKVLGEIEGITDLTPEDAEELLNETK